MAQVFAEIDDKLRAWIERQHGSFGLARTRTHPGRRLIADQIRAESGKSVGAVRI
ncbi:MAG TPA: hypothetical protein VIU11_27840 [Nakamurella sp.]